MFDALGADALAALLLLAAILNLKRIVTFFNLSKVRVRAAEWAPVARAELPPHVARVLACVEPALKEFGFEFVCALSAEPINALDPRSHVFAELYWHPELAILADVEPAEPTTGQAAKVHFLSMYGDGTLRFTLNREKHIQLPIPPEAAALDVYADDLAGQWRAHREALAKDAEQRTPVTDRGEALRRHAAFGPARWVEYMSEIGWARQDPDGLFYFTPLGAWRYAAQLARPPKEALMAATRPYRNDPAPDKKAARLAEMDTVAANIALAGFPYPRWLKVGLFTLTLAASAVLFQGGFGAESAAALLVVLLIHELGHFTAMKAFGYRNLSIFFLPLLGAAATGHKPDARPWQEAVVLLAGPVAGLAAAIAVTQLSAEALPPFALDTMRTFVWMGLFVNLFNLLPFGVLDGGRLFELAVLGRFPRARAVFTTLGALLGLGYAVMNRSPTLAIAMLVLLSATRIQFGSAAIISAIRAKARGAGLTSLSGEQAIAALGHQFARGDFGGDGAKGWMRRANIAKLAYPRLLQGTPGLGVAVGVLIAQGVALIGPLVLLIWAMQQPERPPLMRETAAEKMAEASRPPRSRTPEAESAHRALVARFDAEPSVEAKWTMLDDYARRQEEGESDYNAMVANEKWITQQRAALIDKLPENHPARLAATLDKAGADAATALAVVSGLTENGARPAVDLDEERFALLLDAYRRLGGAATPEALARVGTDLDALWPAVSVPDHPRFAHAPEIASIRAHVAFASGQPDETLIWLDRYVAAARDDEHAPVTRAWFLIDAGRADDALAQAKDALRDTRVVNLRRKAWQQLAGWAEMSRGHPREADVYFQAILAEQTARANSYADELPWWQRFLVKLQTKPVFLRTNANTLNHLAALEAYAPEQAARLKAGLRAPPPVDGQRRTAPVVIDTDGWGKARTSAYRKLIAELGYPAPETDVPPGVGW